MAHFEALKPQSALTETGEEHGHHPRDNTQECDHSCGSSECPPYGFARASVHAFFS